MEVCLIFYQCLLCLFLGIILRGQSLIDLIPCKHEQHDTHWLSGFLLSLSVTMIRNSRLIIPHLWLVRKVNPGPWLADWANQLIPKPRNFALSTCKLHTDHISIQQKCNLRVTSTLQQHYWSKFNWIWQILTHRTSFVVIIVEFYIILLISKHIQHLTWIPSTCWVMEN